MLDNITNVFGAFDGMSNGQIALNRIGIKYDNYFASEIDKYAMKVANYNYPKTIQLGDITKINGCDLPNIELMLAGSPCQGFSFSGKGLNFNDPRSKLFFDFVRLLEEINPKYFLLENVVMKKEHEKVITGYLGVEPIMINSNLISAQNRKRLYWTNIPDIKQPEDKNITWEQIREYGVSDNFYYSPKGLEWIRRHGERKNKKLTIWRNDEKCQMIEASHCKNYSSQRYFGIEDEKGLRYITPRECERAQTVPDDYTSCVSNSQRYKMLGNGWTVDVICHILKNII